MRVVIRVSPLALTNIHGPMRVVNNTSGLKKSEADNARTNLLAEAEKFLLKITQLTSLEFIAFKNHLRFCPAAVSKP